MGRVPASERCPQCAGTKNYRREKDIGPRRFRCRRCGQTFNVADIPKRSPSAGPGRPHGAASGARVKNGTITPPLAVDFLEWAHSVAASQHGSSMRKRLEGLFGGRPNGKHPH
jgi:rubredoxin